MLDLRSPEEYTIGIGHSGDVNSVAFSPNGKRIVSGSDDWTVRVWDAGSANLLLTLQGHEKEVTSVSFSPDGNIIASGSLDQTIKLWIAMPENETVISDQRENFPNEESRVFPSENY